MSSQKPGMRKNIFTYLAVLLFFVVSVSGMVFLLDKDDPKEVDADTMQIAMLTDASRQEHSHSEVGVECFQCHVSVGTEGPQKEVDTEQCFACHNGSYEGLAPVTASMEPNPHEPYHYEDMDCSQCHSVHGQSQLLCSQCHTFEWEADLGDDWLQ